MPQSVFLDDSKEAAARVHYTFAVFLWPFSLWHQSMWKGKMSDE